MYLTRSVSCDIKFFEIKMNKNQPKNHNYFILNINIKNKKIHQRIRPMKKEDKNIDTCYIHSNSPFD